MIKRIVFWITIAGSLQIFFNNCGFKSGRVGEDMGEVPLASRIDLKPEEQHYSLQSADQLARSMASVTGVEPTRSITDEYNARRTLLSEDQTLESVSSPMMISITNIASRFCDELVDQESKKESSQRRFFGAVNFGAAVGGLNNDGYGQVLNQLGLGFWGRVPSEEEKVLLLEAKGEFVSAIPGNRQNSSSETKKLMLFTCSGMLSSFDFVSL